MARPAILRRLAAGAIFVTVAGCSTAGVPSPDPADPSDAVTASPSGPASAYLVSAPPATAPPTASGSIAASNSPAGSLADAVNGLLASNSAAFKLLVTRFKPDVPVEVAAAASGVVDPAADRGQMRFELLPNESEGSPFAFGAFDIAWDATNYWTKAGADDLEGAWQHTTREAAPGMALIGRVNEEPLALLRLAAAAQPDDIEVQAAQLDGRSAERWLVSVPADQAGDVFVPPETYLAFSQVFGRPDLPLEVWLVDGEVARVGYVLEREKAPYGGPDRIETWYDWSAIGEPAELRLPPDGTIEEIDP